MNFIKYFTALPLSQKVFYLIMVVFGCIFYTTLIANHYYFRTYAYDYATYNFAFWDYSHLHISINPLYFVWGIKHKTFLQDHFSFTLMYFVPVYWLLNWLTGSYTLLIIQVTLMLWSAWALYRIVKLKTNDDWLAVTAVLYNFLLQGWYCSLSSDCNILIMVCCFVPLFLLCFELKKYFVAFIVFLLILFSREDMPLWLIFIFIVLITWHWREKKIVGYCIAGILLTLAYFVLLFKVFIPMTETKEIRYSLFEYSALGATPLEALLHCIVHPIGTFKLLYINPLPNHLLDGIKIEFYIVYLLSGGFLLFFRPQYFIWFIPLIAQKMFNDHAEHWGVGGYYAVPVVTLLPISVFLIISKLKIKWVRYSTALFVCILAFSVTWYKMDIGRAVQWRNVLKENMFDTRFFHSDYNVAKIHTDLKLIPPNAKICASLSILPHLSQRQYAYEFPDVEDAEYLAVLTYRDYYLTNDSTYSAVLHRYMTSPCWKIVADDPPFLLMKKTATNELIDSLECDAEKVNPDKIHYIASNGELLDNAETRDSSVKHTGTYSVRVNKNAPYGLTYHPENFKKGDLIKVSIWKYPALIDTGNLVVSCGKDFCRMCSTGETKDSTGWEQLIMYLTVPEDNSDFRIYVINKTPVNVWFDDLKVVRYPAL